MLRKSNVNKKNYHVVPDSKKWAVKEEGSRRFTSVYNTKQEAIDAARSHASGFVVHGPTGQIFQKLTVSGKLSPMLIRQAVRTVSGKSMSKGSIKKRTAAKKATSKAKRTAN